MGQGGWTDGLQWKEAASSRRMSQARGLAASSTHAGERTSPSAFPRTVKTSRGQFAGRSSSDRGHQKETAEPGVAQLSRTVGRWWPSPRSNLRLVPREYAAPVKSGSLLANSSELTNTLLLHQRYRPCYLHIHQRIDVAIHLEKRGCLCPR